CAAPQDSISGPQTSRSSEEAHLVARLTSARRHQNRCIEAPDRCVTGAACLCRPHGSNRTHDRWYRCSVELRSANYPRPKRANVLPAKTRRRLSSLGFCERNRLPCRRGGPSQTDLARSVHEIRDKAQHPDRLQLCTKTRFSIRLLICRRSFRAYALAVKVCREHREASVATEK